MTFRVLFWTNVKLIYRNRQALFWSLAFPLLFLVILGLSFGGNGGSTAAIGVVDHTNTVVESPEQVADLIRRALEYVPAERLIISTNCGFGREGISRRIAFHKCVSLVQGTNIVRKELGLPEASVRAADPQFAFSGPNP